LPISIINKYHLKCNKQKLIDKKNSPIMAIAMVAMLAFGGTYAYFTATNAELETSGLKTGKVVLGTNSIANITEETIVTNTVVASGVSVASNSNVDTVVVVKFTVSFNDVPVTDATVLSFTQESGWVKSGDYLLKAVSGSDSTQNVAVCGEIKFVGSSKATTDDKGAVTYDKDYMDKNVSISIQSWAVQAAHVTDYTGPLTTTNAPAILTALGLGA